MSQIEFFVLLAALAVVIAAAGARRCCARAAAPGRRRRRPGRTHRAGRARSAHAAANHGASHARRRCSSSRPRRTARQLRRPLQAQGLVGRDEQARGLKQFADSMNQALARLTESNAARMQEVRATLEAKIKDLQADNGARLEEMRKTVDEKLHATLETRLSASFQQVSERLERVHQGLGEMQQLALGVGDLKRVLTNVKTRGTWGEVQLEMLLEQVLTPEQYAKNVETIAGSGARVEFALKLPGQIEGGAPVWMPIDAKFPKEQYERLLEAADRADADGVALAGRELERAVRGEAKTISEKYVSPPHTTDFAILFLPTEGLYAEVMRRPGLADELQRAAPHQHRRAVDLVGAAQQLADGLPHAGAGEALVGSVAGAGRGEDGVRQIRRRAGRDQADVGARRQEYRIGRNPQPPDGAQAEDGGGAAERSGAAAAG